MIAAVELLTNLFTAYAVLGAVFAVAFVTVGISRIDPTAKGSGTGFRLIVFPGAAALWPLLLGRWIGKVRSGV